MAEAEVNWGVEDKEEMLIARMTGSKEGRKQERRMAHGVRVFMSTALFPGSRCK